jgi:nucleoside-diphosphate-sugar epimerase
MRIVVTGASGNVGTSVLQALAQEPAVEQIVGIARRLPAAGAGFQKTVWKQADVARDELEPLFADAAAVIHLAWLIQPSRNKALTREVNVHGSQRVFQALAAARVPALVHASSVGAYAPGPRGRAVDESWPTTGIASSFYSRHKAEVERLLDRFEEEHPRIRTVRMRPALSFKGLAATGIRRLFIGPLLPSALMRPGMIPALPFPRGLRTQAVHSLDVGHAYRLAATRPVRGAFNIAAEPVLDAAVIGRMLGARTLQLPPVLLRGAAWASWQLRLQPTSPGWLDMGMLSPIMNTARARGELGWEPRYSAEQAVQELLDGLRRREGMGTPPLEPQRSDTSSNRVPRSPAGRMQ